MWVWGEGGLDTQVARVDRPHHRSNPVRYPIRELLGVNDDWTKSIILTSLR